MNETAPLIVDSEALLRLGNDLLHRGRLDEARTTFRQILEQDQTNLKATLALGRLEKRLLDNAAACRLLRAAVTMDPNNLAAWTDLAAVLRDLDQAEEAASIYRKILATNPDHLQSHIGLAWIARASHHQETARAHFTIAAESLRSAAEREPNSLQILTQLATVLRELDRTDEAVAIYRNILAQNPGHLQSHLGLGWIARKRGDDEAALAHFRTASEFNPLDLQPRIALARLLELMHRYLEAEAVYQRVIAQAPDHPQALKALGALALKRYDWAGALEHLRAAAKSDPKNIQVRIDLGRAFCGLSRWDDAERNYKSILEDSPGNVEAMIGLADTAKGRGDTQSARAWFEEAAAAAPLDFRLKQEIRRLKAAQDGYDWKAELEDAVAVARSASASVRSQMEAVEILIKYGLTEVARPALLRLEASLPDARRFLMAVRQIERSGLAQPLTASGDVDPAENQLESLRGFIEIPVPKTDTLLIVFGGTNNRVSITFSLLHKILRKTGVSIVYCRDLQQEWYTQGVVGLGDDFQSTVDGFRALAKQHGAKRILIVGSCVGCYAALRFGLSLNAQAVLGLGPKIGTVDDILQPHERTRLTGIRERLPPGYKTIHVLYHETAALPKVDLVFGEHFTVDACGLSSLADVPGITITGIPDSDDPVKDLLVRGLLEPLLREFVAKGTVSPELHAQISTSATPQYSHAE